jgi:hypothetical protein
MTTPAPTPSPTPASGLVGYLQAWGGIIAALATICALLISASTWLEQRSLNSAQESLNRQQQEINGYELDRDRKIHSSLVSWWAQNAGIGEFGMEWNLVIQNRGANPIGGVRITAEKHGPLPRKTLEIGALAPCTLLTIKSSYLDGQKLWLSTRIKRFGKTYSKVDFLDVEGKGWRRGDDGKLAPLDGKWPGDNVTENLLYSGGEESHLAIYKTLPDCGKA